MAVFTWKSTPLPNTPRILFPSIHPADVFGYVAQTDKPENADEELCLFRDISLASLSPIENLISCNFGVRVFLKAFVVSPCLPQQ